MIVVQDLQEVNGELLPVRPSMAHDLNGQQWVLNPEKVAAILAKQRADAALKVTAWRDQEELMGIVFQHIGHDWDGGVKVRTRLDTVASLPALPADYFWTDANNHDVPMDLLDIKALRDAHEIAIATRGWEIHQRQRHMKTDIETLEGNALLNYKPDWPSTS